MRSPRAPSREAGLALLSALLSVALLTVVVVELTDATLVEVHSSRNAGNAVAAQLLARSAEVAGEALLVQDAKDNPAVTAADGLWAMPFTVPTRTGTLGLQISDEEGKLDLNAVADRRMRPALERLFSSLGLDPSLLDAVASWIDPDPQGVAGREASQYCALPMPCEPRHGPLLGLDELRLIRGFDARAIRLLRPYVSAYGRKPQIGSAVNVNTADPLVLRALGCEVGSDFRPPPGGFRQLTDVAECKEARRLLKVTSGVFSIEASGTVGGVTQTASAVVERNARRATRLAWRERPVSDLAPSEVP